MARTRVRLRPDGVHEILSQRRRRGLLVFPWIAAAASVLAAGITRTPALLAVIWAPVALVAASFLVARLVVWRPDRGGTEPHPIRAPDRAQVRPIRPPPDASTRGA